ncbi:hypothetical protein Sango_1905200 [Sesamum angolense]|uniref:DUF8040 domain-containing protein n=1 Tax=Sesamum angolense TaxID=2727404 RepID=A0AAE1WJ98_9LAMI|nr:hypothetical protein Sango_1905200 [Sesamum angolense]
MASSGVNGGLESNSAGGSPGTLGTPESNESDVLEEFYVFRDLICPELFRENVSRNTSALQGAGGLLPQGLTSRVTSIEEVALFMQTVGMHKRHRDNMERFQHSLETINRRFHRVFFALCAMALELITPSNFTEPHPRVANNLDFYPYFKINTTSFIAQLHIVVIWRVLDFHRRTTGLSNVEQRFMWMILDDNTRAPMRDDARAETQMVPRHHSMTRDIETFVMVFPLELRPRASAHYPLARRYYQYPEPHYPSMLEVWGPFCHTGIPVEAPDDTQNAESSNVGRSLVRDGDDAPIVISDSTVPSVQSHTHIASWDAVEHVAHDDGGPRLGRSTSLAA